VTTAQTAKPATPVPDAPWKINLDRFALNGLGVQFTDAGFAQPLQAEVGNIQIGFAAKARRRCRNPGCGGRFGYRYFRYPSAFRRLHRTRCSCSAALRWLKAASTWLRVRPVSAGQLSNGKIDLAARCARRPGVAGCLHPASGKPVARASAAGKHPSKTAAAEEAWGYQIEQINLAGFQVGILR
jgi:hypothetical protein